MCKLLILSHLTKNHTNYNWINILFIYFSLSLSVVQQPKPHSHSHSHSSAIEIQEKKVAKSSQSTKPLKKKPIYMNQ